MDDCHTLGDHLRRTRLIRNESQPCVAQKLGTTTTTITNWELNRNEPTHKHLPGILNYLAYTPLFDFAGTSPRQRLRQHLYTKGISRKECAKQLGMDEQTMRRIYDGKRVFNKTIQTLGTYLQAPLP